MSPPQTRWTVAVVLALALGTLPGCPSGRTEPPEPGIWHARLISPGGDLPFRLTLRRAGNFWTGTVGNGSESMEIPSVTWDEEDRVLVLHFDPYDAEIRATVDRNGQRLTGRWQRTTGPGTTAELFFHATRGAAPRFSTLPGRTTHSLILPERWRVSFSSDENDAVAILHLDADGTVEGTILTATGDYGHLAGSLEGDRLRLSTFNGAHAFLFDARLSEDEQGLRLAGRFWSRDTWQEEWVARPDPSAELVDPLQQSSWNEEVAFRDLTFSRLDGTPVTLREIAPAGPLILELFGTWCPNCNDAMPVLQALQTKYASQGLQVVGIAFEVTGDPARDAKQVAAYAEHHGLDFPLLLGGIHNKERATEAFQALDRIRAYPTTIFLGADGRPQAIHSGFSGPATGRAFEETKEMFTRLTLAILEPRTSEAGEQ